LIWSVDAEARFTFVNGAAREVYGYEPEELLGLSFFEIMDPQYYHQDLKKFKETVAHVDELNGVETYIRHRDGRQLILSANSIVVRDADGKVVGVTGSSRDITVRKQVEKVLKEERNLLRTLIDNLPDRIYVMDKDGRKTLSNTADWQASGGKTMEDVIGKTDLETYPAALAEEFWRLNREVIDSGTPVINHEEPGFDVEGKPVSILSTKVPLKDSQGKVVGLVGIGRDITERKQDEARINDLLALNERILNYSPLGILTYKVTGECVFANEKAAQIVGTRVEQLRAQNFHTIKSWKKSGLYGLVELAIESRSVVTADIHHLSTFGKDVWMTVHCVTFKSKDEEHVLLSVSDITERKRAEELLRQSEERFSSAFEYASIGMALVTPEGQWLRVNRALCDLIGYSEAELLEKTFQDITHPDDLQSDLDYVHQLLRGETNSYQMEKRYFHKSGRWVWVLLSVSLVRDNQGKPLYFISQIQDITERKQAEDALRLENERFLRFVESNIVGIVIADAAGNIVLTNDYYLNILGVTRQDFRAGKVDWRKFTPPEWLPADEKAIAELRARGVCEPYEKEYIRA
ncbi:MAG: PAS domain S-box protein, partial [Chloroflexi bacterium]